MVQYDRLKLNYKRFGITVTVECWETGVDNGNNRSNVHVKVTVKTNSTTYNNADTAYVKGNVSCNGQSIDIGKSIFRISKSTTKVVYDSDVGPFNHNGDGTCGNATASMTVYVTSSSGSNGTYTGSCGMSTIPRYFSSTPNLWVHSYDENNVTFGWSTSETCSWVRWHFDGGSGWTDVGNPNATSGYFTVGGWGVNQNHYIYIEARRSDSGLWSNSGNVWCTTHNYPYITSAPNFNIGDQNTISIYNPLGRYVQVYTKNASGTEKGGDGTRGTSISGYNNSEWKSHWYNGIKGGSRGVYQIRLVCSELGRDSGYYNGGTYYAKLAECKPNFTTYEITDYNSTTQSLTGSSYSNPRFVKGYSKPRFRITSANKATVNSTYPSNGISKYKLGASGVTKEVSFSNDEIVSDIDVIVNTKDTSVTVYDVRGAEQKAYTSATWLEYFKPYVEAASGERSNNGVGEEIKISMTGGWWNNSFGSQANAIQNIYYWYKKTSDSTYTAGTNKVTFTTSGNTVTVSEMKVDGPGDDKEWDVQSSFNFKVQIIDKLDQSTEYEFVVQAGSPGLSIYKNKVAIAARYNEDLGGPFQVNGECGAYYPVGSIYISTNAKSPALLFGGSWEQIKDRFLLAVGNTYKTVNTTGGNSSINIQHRHSFNLKGQSSYTLNSWGLHIIGPSGADGVSNADIYTNYQGSTNQSIIPPYLTVYVWKRTA